MITRHKIGDLVFSYGACEIRGKFSRRLAAIYLSVIINIHDGGDTGWITYDLAPIRGGKLRVNNGTLINLKDVDKIVWTD
tara:strand:- start:12976 stop:13215 length:240 start_codon:yes stop_codon:yes gene_type:complete